MAEFSQIHHTFTDKRLSITRETELLQSYVRTSVDEEKIDNDDDNINIIELNPVPKQEINDNNANEQVNIDDKKKSIDDVCATEAVKKKVIRRRTRRRRNAREELYCDKDRAAAVNLGSKDIKHSLRLKRKQDRSKALQIPEEAEPGTFLALGNYEMNRGDLNNALNFITKALELNPTEKCALVARSKCYILLGQPEKALQDAELSLKIDKNFLKAIYQKAEALYHLGNFEYSLVYYYRGLHKRYDSNQFKLGIDKARKAIENAIGDNFTFRKYLNGTERTTTTTTRSMSASITTKSSQRTTPLSTTSATRPKTTRPNRLLRELAPDKEYLDKLMKNPNIKCKYKSDDGGDNSNIIERIEETIEYLNSRQEFWRQQLPTHLK